MTITFCSPFVSYYATYHFKKILKVDHDTEGCKNLGNFRLKLLICPKGIFHEKLTSITYVYLASPIIQQHFRQILRVYRYI